MTATAATFIRSRARRSLGLTKLYLAVSLAERTCQHTSGLIAMAARFSKPWNASLGLPYICSLSLTAAPNGQMRKEAGGGAEGKLKGGVVVLCEAPAVEAHHDEGVGQQAVGLLKGAHVFVPGMSAWSSGGLRHYRSTRKTHFEFAMARHAGVTSQRLGHTAWQREQSRQTRRQVSLLTRSKVSLLIRSRARDGRLSRQWRAQVGRRPGRRLEVWWPGVDVDGC